MRKLFFIFVMLLSTSVSFAFDTNISFGIQEQKTPEGYQQYVGKSFFVRPAYGKLETWEKSGFKYNKSYEGKIFITEKKEIALV